MSNDQFDDIYKFNGHQDAMLSLQFTNHAIPRHFKHRSVKYAQEVAFNTELDRMVDKGINVEENYPLEWCSTMFVHHKANGPLWVGMNPRYLNQYLCRPVYPMREIDYIFPCVRSAPYFSKLDLTQGFWHFKLDEPSSR